MGQNYTFPFDTCEIPSPGSLISQPFSAGINFAVTVFLVAYLFRAKTSFVRLVIVSYALFQAWHTFSHAYHIQGSIQTNIVHVLGYFMTFSTLAAILYLSGESLSGGILLILVLLVACDLSYWLFVKGIATVFTGLLIFSFVIVIHWKVLPVFFRKRLIWMIPCTALIFVLIINEKLNCEAMVNQWGNLPYHIAIEIIGGILFCALADAFIQWDYHS